MDTDHAVDCAHSQMAEGLQGRAVAEGQCGRDRKRSKLYPNRPDHATSRKAY